MGWVYDQNGRASRAKANPSASLNPKTSNSPYNGLGVSGVLAAFPDSVSGSGSTAHHSSSLSNLCAARELSEIAALFRSDSCASVSCIAANC